MATTMTQISEAMPRRLWESISRRAGGVSGEDPNGLRHRWVSEALVKAALERFIDSHPRLQRPEPPLLPTTAEMSRRMPPIKILSVAAVHKAVMSRAELGRPGHEVFKSAEDVDYAGAASAFQCNRIRPPEAERIISWR